MKTDPHTKPQSHEGNPSQRSAPALVFPQLPIRVHPFPFAGQHSPLRASAPPREISLCVASLAPARLALRAAFGRLPGQRPLARVPVSAFRSPVSSSPAFSLVELLVVMAIIGMMVGLSALAVSGMRAPAVQHAADQVMSGLSLARQIAITKNTQAALLIADKTSTGFPTNGPYRHWSVVYSNKGNSTWTFAKDWEELPNGALIGELLGDTYNSLNKNPYAPTPGSILAAAQFVPGNTTFTIYKDTNFTISPIISSANIPSIKFTSDGSATGSAEALRIVPGSALNGNATITSSNQYYFVETDLTTGRIRMRSPESYK